MATHTVDELVAIFRPPRRVDTGLLVWLATGMLVLVVFLLRDPAVWTREVPESLIIPLAEWLSAAMTWFTDNFRWLFRGLSWLLSWPLGWVRGFLQWLPWPATVLACAGLGYAAGGLRLATFTACALMYMVITGYWEKTMFTLALAGVAVAIAVVAGLFAGILGLRSARARRVIQPTLDVMQTVPTFAYLIPILLLFGLGPVLGVIASAIYAAPPMARNVMLGLSRVPVEIVESATMSGSSKRQLLWWVQVPVALPTILVGVNQTIMAGLSMVVIAAMLGGFLDIGYEVFTTMKKAQFGQSILSGLVIALLAMVMDRISRGFANREVGIRADPKVVSRRRVVLWGVLAAAAMLSASAELAPALRVYPEAWVLYPADAMNDALDWFTRTFFVITQAIKNSTLFFLLLPLKVGMVESVRPRIWGFEMSVSVSVIYVLLIAIVALALARLSSWRAAVGITTMATLYYHGTTGIPWLAFILMAAVLAYQTGGWRVCLLSIGGLSFIAFTGLWQQAMISIQLCGAAVVIAFLIGALLGVWAALNDRVSAFLRPINDTLQTMPIFVFLIPGVMVFLVGEFTALVAIVMYATVPSIRYTEHGIRNVPPHIVEAARAFGTTRWQLLSQVQLPMALPEIMLGLNQTIMMGLAMVVVAALVGAKGLGQEVMIALVWADVGRGVTSGLSVALIAIIIDRIIQSWSVRKKAALGLA